MTRRMASRLVDGESSTMHEEYALILILTKSHEVAATVVVIKV